MLLNRIFYTVLALSTLAPVLLAAWQIGADLKLLQALIQLGLGMVIPAALSLVTAALCWSARAFQIMIGLIGGAMTATLSALCAALMRSGAGEVWLGFGLLYASVFAFQVLLLLVVTIGMSAYAGSRG